MTEDSAPKLLRVVLVDQQPVVREGLRAMLGSQPGIQVVGEATSGEEAVERVSQLEPDVVLTDILMPDISGAELIRRMRAARPGTAVIVLTLSDDVRTMVESLSAGASGYLARDFSRELLFHAIHVAARGGIMVKSELLPRALKSSRWASAQPQKEPTGQPVAERFTPREMDVLRLVARGYGNRDIASQLNLAEVTVKKHVQSLMGKLAVAGRTHAAIAAIRLGLVD